eukprot:135763_1
MSSCQSNGEKTRPVPLPIEGRRNILITSALPYVNNVPHLGNLIGCVLSADVYSRYCRLRGYNSIYICGTDEYGTATENKAKQEGVSPQEICEKYYKIHKEIYEWFDIDFDIFGRTSTSEQTEITQDIFRHLDKNGCIDEKEIEQLFCEKCVTPLADRFVEGTCPKCHYDNARGDQCDACGGLLDPTELVRPRCKACSTTPVPRKTRHLFLRLTHLTERLEKWMKESSVKGEWSSNSTSTAFAWLKRGLHDRCITRDLKWGTPVPKAGFEDKVFYVWFDAPIGYISITACLTPEWRQWWYNDKKVDLVQFMGKDNVPFHTVMFPATMLGADDGFTMLHHISTTEYLNYEGGKFSKSNNTGVFGDNAKETGIPSEVWRYYLLSNRPESSDSDFSWTDLATKNNTELLNNFGNFVNRTLKFINSNFHSKVPEINVLDIDQEFIDSANAYIAQYVADLELVRIKSAIRQAMEVSRLGNVYLQTAAPWKLVKSTDPVDQMRAATVLGICANVVKMLMNLLYPYMPSVSAKIAEQLNVPAEFTLPNPFLELSLTPRHEIGQAAVLFTKLSADEVEGFRKKFGGIESDRPEFPLDLVVGTVTEVEDHPTAEHLWVLKVLIGSGAHATTQIVTNLRTSKVVDDVLQKKVVVLNNIKKSKFQGVSSQAMLMCAQGDSGFSLLTSTQPNGVRVKPDGANVKVKKNYKYKKNFPELNMRTDDASKPLFGDLPLFAEGDPVCLLEPMASAKIV